jgi:hypothetical protein
LRAFCAIPKVFTNKTSPSWVAHRTRLTHSVALSAHDRGVVVRRIVGIRRGVVVRRIVRVRRAVVGVVRIGRVVSLISVVTTGNGEREAKQNAHISQISKHVLSCHHISYTEKARTVEKSRNCVNHIAEMSQMRGIIDSG